MIKIKNKKLLLIILATLAITFSKNSFAENKTLNQVQALTVLTKFAFAIASNVQELKENELAALKLEITYLSLDIADTTLKMVNDFKSVSLLEEAVGIYHLVKIFQNIHTINLKKSAEQKKNDSTTTNNTEKDKKQKELAKKIIYSIIKYYALAYETGSSLAFTSSDEDARILFSNISGFTKLLYDLIDNATPKIRSKALLLLSPIALMASYSIAQDQHQKRIYENYIHEQQEQNEKLEAEYRKHEEEQRKKQEKRKRKEAEKMKCILSKIQNKDEKCSICQDSFKTRETIGILNCNGDHFYHKDCIIPWLETDPESSCPLCRQKHVVISKNLTLEETK